MQTENGNRYAIHALRERRAAIDGELRQCEQRIRHLKEMLGHLDATLSLFDPEGNPKAIKAKRPYKRVKLFGAGKMLCHCVIFVLNKANMTLDRGHVKH